MTADDTLLTSDNHALLAGVGNAVYGNSGISFRQPQRGWPDNG